MIEVYELTKRYGERLAVDQASFSAPRGQILGFLGPNGAGKSTTMRMLTGFLPPSSGSARVAGFDIVEEADEVRRRIGYLPENPPLYPDMTVSAYLSFVARLKGVPSRQLRSARDEVMERTGLTAVAGRILARLSKGYKQRVGLAQALVHDPEVLVLDEPTIGLDPQQIIEIRELIRGLSGERTVILSTHILPEVSQVCDAVVIINEGKVICEDTRENLTRNETLEEVFLRLITADTAKRESTEAPAAEQEDAR